MNARFSAGLAAAWLSAVMMKPIRTFGVAVVAFAAPALFALPAAADGPRGETIARIETPLLGAHITLSTSSRHEPYRGHRYSGRNQWGQSDREVRELSRSAVQSCRAAIRAEGRRAGFREVDIDDDRRVRQIGPQGFLVTFDEVEFERGRRDIETRVTCEVRRGRVVSLAGIPASHPPRHDRGKGRYW